MGAPRGFSAAKADLIAALTDGRVQHEEREAVAEKNLLAVGEVTVAEVVAALQRCKGGDHSSSDHHLSKLRDRGIKVHCFTPMSTGRRWYIKAYFLDGGPTLPEAIMISVHY